jgi:ABC-2 type transport system permease protein
MTTAPARSAAQAQAQAAAQPGRMNLWRLEWLRLTRTPRAIAVCAVFLFIGFIEPVATKYENDLIGRLGHGARVSLPPPTPADGLNSYVTEITLVGLIVVVALAAGAFCFDTRHGVATFLRTRVNDMWQLVVPRFAVSAGAAAVAYVLGTLCAWYETQVLIGSLRFGAVVGGMVCGTVYVVFAVALTALAASLVRSVVGTIATALAFLVVLPIASVLHAISDWLPSALVNGPVALANGTQHLSHFVPSLTVSVAVSAAALTVAERRLRAREI